MNTGTFSTLTRRLTAWMPSLRIGLRVEHDHLQLLAVDAAGLVDLGHGPFGGLDLILSVERLRAGQRHGKSEAKHVLRRRGCRGCERKRRHAAAATSVRRDDRTLCIKCSPGVDGMFTPRRDRPI